MSDLGSGVVLGRGFRPFFLLAGIQAVLGMSAWLAVLRGVGPQPGWATPFQWHAHEMIFGFAAAAVAGFLLTSVPVWTGRAALTGLPLAALAGWWLVGRVVVFFADVIAMPWLVAAVDVSFLVIVAGVIGDSIYRAQSRRNYGFPVVVAMLSIANGLMHLDAVAWSPRVDSMGARMGVGLLVILIATLAGRLIPLFTRAALKRAGRDAQIESDPRVDAVALAAIVLFVSIDVVAPGSNLSAAVALIAAAACVLRTRGWGMRASFEDPLLWSMHVAHAFIPIGLAALALAALSDAIARGIAVHALTVGAIGGMILAIMTRVTLGHTGRDFRAPRGIPLAYLLVLIAGLSRTALPWVLPAWTTALLMISGVCWIAAFALFLAIQGPQLVSPRVDGKPG